MWQVVDKIDKYVIEKIKEMRIEKGYSQYRLAYELGQSESLIKKVESGKYGKKYNLSHLNKIAIIFDCSIRDFLPEKYIEE